jgi:hypothetical protein
LTVGCPPGGSTEEEKPEQEYKSTETKNYRKRPEVGRGRRIGWGKGIQKCK